MTILITKASGIQEPFSEEKLRRSLERTHASPNAIATVLTTIKNTLTPGTTTYDIYKTAFKLLKTQAHSIASRYQLKRSLMELGPDGHYFEQFVGKLLQAEGYSVEVSQIIPGFCVTHEVDVIGQTDTHIVYVECKLHNHPGTKSDVKVALYVQARFEDILTKHKNTPDHINKSHEMWVVTNTALTSDAIQYAQCKGLHAIGWNHPPDNSLSTRIERAQLFPITCLLSLNTSVKKRLLEIGIITCEDLMQRLPTIAQIIKNPTIQANLEHEIHILRQLTPHP